MPTVQCEDCGKFLKKENVTRYVDYTEGFEEYVGYCDKCLAKRKEWQECLE